MEVRTKKVTLCTTLETRTAQEQKMDNLSGEVIHVYNITRCLCRLRTIQKTRCKIKKSPNSGGMKGRAFIYDPDGYLVEILPKQNPFPQQDTGQ